MKKRLILAILGLGIAIVGQGKAFVAGECMADRDKWVKQAFAKGQLPFSFELDGKASDSFIGSWKRSLSAGTVDEDGRICRTLTLTSPLKDMQVRCEIVSYTDFPAVEWTLHFTNLSDRNSPRISKVKAADISLESPSKSDFKLYTAQGCNAIDRDFHLMVHEIAADSTYRFVPTGGRPSSKTAFPFYNIDAGKGCGAFFSIGWTGSWFADFSLTEAGGLHMDAGMLNTDLFLYPGESIRTPLVSVLFWKGEDRIDGNNAFRRFVLAHHSPKRNGKTIQPPLCSGFDYGDPAPCGEYEALTQIFASAVIERQERFGIRPEIYWLDAGWYEGCNAPQSAYEGRNWYTTAGNWSADPERFPDGLKGLSELVHKSGAEFMVWLEPERVYEGSRWHGEHPEWLLNYKDSKHHILDLGNPDALDFLCHYMEKFFVDNGIDHYRQDFNINPSNYWAAADPEGRQGITEIRYVEGLYKYWDFLRERFPNMIIDNCASGGRRFDMETISRSIPLWRTDCHYGEPTCQQCHNYGLSQFLPIHGTGIYYADKYCSRSGLSSAYAWFGEIFSRQNSIDDMRHTFSTFRDLRNYYLADYYPLSGDGDITGTDKWIAWQFNDAADGSGILQAFRRDDAPEAEYTVMPRGLKKDAMYDILDDNTGLSIRKKGEELMSGFTIVLPEKRSSALFIYRISAD